MAGVANNQDVFMLFGDSITQGSFEPGYVGVGQRLAHVYARRLDVLNRGLSGYNTDWGLEVLKKCIVRRADAEPRIRIITIWFGANDACLIPSPQHVPRESSGRSPGTHIMLITPPPVNTEVRAANLAARDPPIALDRNFLVTKQYAEAVLEVGALEGVAVVNIWSAIFKAAGEKEQNLTQFLVDGLHPNKAGYELVYESLIETIREQHPDVHYENMPFSFPPWGEIDWNNPKECF
jgi:lysophospholipase L1-like esterase